MSETYTKGMKQDNKQYNVVIFKFQVPPKLKNDKNRYKQCKDAV